MKKTVYLSLVFFVLSTLFSFADAALEVPAKTEEIRDIIVVKGMVLKGRVTNIGREKLSFKLRYSDGTNRIDYKDIDSIYTKYNYRISFKRMDIEGRIVAIEENKKYLKILEGNKERTVKIADIDNFVMALSEDDSFENIVRNTFPYTKGGVHVGLQSESGINKKNTANLRTNLKRKIEEHETRLFLNYNFETTQTADTPKVENKDELIATVVYKNYFKNEQFLFAALAAEYDRPRQIQQRWLPSIGYGYKFTFDKALWLEPALGLAYATTSYTDNQYVDDQFSAATLRLSGEYRMDDVMYIGTLIIDGNIMYYPSLTEPSEHWIMRSNLGFTIPLFDFLSVKFIIDYINDSSPDPKIGNNKTTTNLLFGFDF
jgi:hypothetical protein